MRPGTVRGRIIILSFLAFSAAAGAAEQKGGEKRLADPHPSWTVAVAAFDTAELDVSDRLAGELIAGTLAKALSGLRTRQYPAPEREAYSRRLAALNLEAAVKELSAKRSSRDALFFSGLAKWKYDKELAAAEVSVKTAQAAYAAALDARPDVVPEKPIASAKENAGGVLFAAPSKAEERTFCTLRAYDALLLGRVNPYYGRTAVSIRLYSPYLDADLYADETMFSVVNRDAALSELAQRLAAAVSGRTPATIAVRADPEDASISLAGAFAGKGAVGPIERDPGKVLIAAERDGFDRFEESFDVSPGERVDLRIALPALEKNAMTVKAFDPLGEADGSAVRLDGLYVGASPFGADIPRGLLSYVEAEAPGGLGATAVVRSVGPGTIPLRLVEGIPKTATPTEDARKQFYGAFGRFSLTMPFAFFFSGLAFSYDNAAIVYNSAALAGRSNQAAYASAALWTVSAAFAVESVFRFVRYLRNSGARAVTLVDVDQS